MARFVQQEETNKSTNERVAALETLDGENDRTETERRRLFATTKPNPGAGKPTDEANPANIDPIRTTDGSDSLSSR